METLLLMTSLVLGVTTLGRPDVPDAPEKVQPIAVGASVPKVMVKTLEGNTVELPKLLSKQPTVLVFYRGGWCPFCNMQMGGLQRVEGDLKKLGYRIIAITPDNAVELRKSIGKHKLTYQLVSDSPMEATRAFGLAYRVNDDLFMQLKGAGIDLEASSGEKHHQLPVPAVFLIDKKGMIRYRYFNSDYKIRLSPEELLAAAKENPAK